MSDFEEFVDTLKDATKELVSDIETAWQELKEDLHETITVKYLRPGGVVYCKSQCKKYYGCCCITYNRIQNRRDKLQNKIAENRCSAYNNRRNPIIFKCGFSRYFYNTA